MRAPPETGRSLLDFGLMGPEEVNMLTRVAVSRLKRVAALGFALLLPIVFVTIAWAVISLPVAHAAPSSPDAPFPGGTCVDFEGLSAGATYTVGQSFIDSAAVVTVGPFEWSNGTVYAGGQALSLIHI